MADLTSNRLALAIQAVLKRFDHTPACACRDCTLMSELNAAFTDSIRSDETTDDMQILRGIVDNQAAGREFLTVSMALLRRIVRAEEPFGVRIAPEKPIIDGHPIGCMCHGCHYYRKHPQCKPVKAPVCTCDSPAAGPCPAHT